MKYDDIYTIGEASHILNISVKTIRYYEYNNLIMPSAKGEYNHNLYSINDIEKLKTITYMTSGGFTTKEIKEELEDN
ncbi:MAG: MerR family transcriptional regulator [Terrisporobacter sp.]|uniref:helix-turn-helix domain-containing protein n=1 Tax=Terrisporobacter sp. TaxID=1965305 RepID=UPI002FC74359